MLVPGESNIAYIFSRYYRMLELIFGATKYITAIDMWSADCVCAELLLGQPLFPGESGIDQLVEIIKILEHQPERKLGAWIQTIRSSSFLKSKLTRGTRIVTNYVSSRYISEKNTSCSSRSGIKDALVFSNSALYYFGGMCTPFL